MTDHSHASHRLLLLAASASVAVAMVLTIPMGLISLIAAHLFVRFARSAKGSGMK